MTREELEAVMVQEEKEPGAFDHLPKERRDEMIHFHDEYVRKWRGTCQFCGAHLTGTRKALREHKCGHDDTE